MTKPTKKLATTARRKLDAVAVLEPRAADAARMLKLLSNDQRLTVLCRLSGGEMSVSELGKHISLTQSALSQHLAKLRAEGLVATRRKAQTIYYRLDDPIAERLIGVLCDLYGGHSTRLGRACRYHLNVDPGLTPNRRKTIAAGHHPVSDA